MRTWRTAVSNLSWGLLAAISCTVLLLEGSASAQFAPSGGALLHGEQAAPPAPPVVVTEPPADTTDGADAAEQEQVKHDIAGFDKANFNGFFVQSRDEQFRLNIGAYTQFRYNLVWRETPPAGDPKFDSGFIAARSRFFFDAGVPNMSFRGEPFFGQDRFDYLFFRLRQNGLTMRDEPIPPIVTKPLRWPDGI